MNETAVKAVKFGFTVVVGTIAGVGTYDLIDRVTGVRQYTKSTDTYNAEEKKFETEKVEFTTELFKKKSFSENVAQTLISSAVGCACGIVAENAVEGWIIIGKGIAEVVTKTV